MNPAVHAIPPSLIRSINARKRPDDLDLGLGEPSLPPPIGAFEAALDWTRRKGSPYSPNAGFPELREIIARRASLMARVEMGVENVCVTVGSEEALYLAIKTMVDPARDEVLIVEPCYLAYAKICILEQVRHRMVPLDPATGFEPDAGRVLDAISPATRLIVLNSPSNPTGRIWSDKELEALATGLEGMGRADVHLLADEVYRELYFGPDPPPSCARFHPATLVADSLSKSHALTGLRIGWLTGPAEAIAAATKVHQFINTAASTFGQRVAIEILSRPEEMPAHRAGYVQNRKLLLDVSAREGLSVIVPEGAFYAFLRLPPGVSDSLGVAERLLDRFRVVTVPGLAFGEAGEGWLRISCATEPDRLAQGLARIAEGLADEVRG